MFRNIEKDAERGQRHKKRTAAKADHGQRNAFGRHHAEHDADVEEGLDDQHGGDSERQVTAEFIGDQHSGADAAPENDHEAEQYGDRPEQAEFFADDGVDGVGVGFGQVEQFLAALHQADAHGATRSDGYLRLLGLVVRVFRGDGFFHAAANPAALVELVDRLETGVDIADDADEAVRLRRNEDAPAQDADQAGNQDVAAFETGDDEDDSGGGAEDDGGPEIGQSYGDGDEADSENRGQECVAAVDGARAHGDEVGEEHRERGFGEFRRLDAEGSEAYPAVLARVCEVDGYKQDYHQAHRGEGDGGTLQLAVVELLHRHHQRDGDRDPDELPQREII